MVLLVLLGYSRLRHEALSFHVDDEIRALTQLTLDLH
jgi:hypothetical protein